MKRLVGNLLAGYAIAVGLWRGVKIAAQEVTTK